MMCVVSNELKLVTGKSGTYRAVGMVQKIFERIVGLGKRLFEYASEGRYGRVIVTFMSIQLPEGRLEGVRQCWVGFSCIKTI
jgi:hypothetical protein